MIFKKTLDMHLKLNTHILIWALFIAYEVLFSYSFSGHFSPLLDYIIFYSLNIFLFYLHVFIVFKNTNDNKPEYGYVILYTLLEIIGYLGVKYLITWTMLKIGFYTSNHTESSFKFIMNGTWRAIYFIAGASSYVFVCLSSASLKRIADLDKQRLNDQLQQELLEKNLLATEIAFLQAQINPHFLFNMLSFLHNSVVKHSEELGDIVIALSDLTRFAFNTPTTDSKIVLDLEVEHIKIYLALNQYRFSNKLLFNLECEGELHSVKIIPLLIMTVVENIFKFGDLTDPTQPATVRIELINDCLNLSVVNSKLRRSHVTSSGIGMNNLVKRLNQFYPGNFTLDISEDEFNYNLNLKLIVPQYDMLYH